MQPKKRVKSRQTKTEVSPCTHLAGVGHCIVIFLSYPSDESA